MVQHLFVRIPCLTTSEENIPQSIYPALKTLTALCIGRNSSIAAYARLITSCPITNLTKIHLGLRCEAAEQTVVKFLVSNALSSGPLPLEEFRYSRLRTKAEAAAIGGSREEFLIIEDCFGGPPVDFGYTQMRNHYQLFVTSLPSSFRKKAH